MIEIKAGPELDRAVAEAIGISFDREDPRGVVIELGEAIHPYMPAMWSPTMVFNPSVDLNAAFSAAEAVGLFRECYLHQDTYWHVWGRPTGCLGPGFNVRGDTPALAICAAILKLKEKGGL